MTIRTPLPTVDEVRDVVIDLIPDWDRPMDRVDVAVRLLEPLGLPYMRQGLINRVGSVLKALQVSGELRRIPQGRGKARWAGEAASPRFTPGRTEEVAHPAREDIELAPVHRSHRP